MSSVKYSLNGVTVQKGTAYPFFNILRPPPYLPPVNDGNIAPTVSDRTLGTWVANVGTWVTATVYPVGTVIVDQNGNAEIVTAISGSGTSGTPEPTWPTVALKTVVDNAGANQITWTMLGRVGTAHCVGASGNWVASFAYLQDDQIRDSNGNIQWCLIPGTSASSAPTWSTLQNGITTETSGVTWFNLGATLGGGGTEGDFTFDMEAKMVQIEFDQETLPILSLMVSESASLGGTFKQIDLSLLNFGIPHGQLVKGLTDGGLPSGAQSITSLSTGGLVGIPHYCHAVLSPRPLFAVPGSSRFYSGVVYKAGASGGKPGLGFTRSKISGWKGEWMAHAVESFPNGARGAALFIQ